MPVSQSFTTSCLLVCVPVQFAVQSHQSNAGSRRQAHTRVAGCFSCYCTLTAEHTFCSHCVACLPVVLFVKAEELQSGCASNLSGVVCLFVRLFACLFAVQEGVGAWSGAMVGRGLARACVVWGQGSREGVILPVVCVCFCVFVCCGVSRYACVLVVV